MTNPLKENLNELFTALDLVSERLSAVPDCEFSHFLVFSAAFNALHEELVRVEDSFRGRGDE